MELTLAHKIVIATLTGTSILGGAFVYTMSQDESMGTPMITGSRNETEKSSLRVTVPLGTPRTVGTSTQPPRQSDTSEEDQSLAVIIPDTQPLGSTNSRENTTATQRLAEEYGIPIQESSFIPADNTYLDQVILRVLANLDPQDEYNYDPTPDTGIGDNKNPEGYQPYSSSDSVSSNNLGSIPNIVLEELQTAFVEILNQLLAKLIDKGYPLSALAANPGSLKDILLGQATSLQIPGLTLPGLNTVDLSDIDITKLTEGETEAVARLGVLYPELIGLEDNPLLTPASITALIDSWSPAQIVENLNISLLTKRIGYQVMAQAPIFDLLPCGERIRRGSPRQYQEGIWSCSLCKRYCGRYVGGGNWIYYSYLYGNGRCGCDQ